MSEFRFGDPFTNPWASDDNPKKHGFYVRTGYRQRGSINNGKYYEFTDKKGRFWQMSGKAVDEALTAPSPSTQENEG